MRVRGAKLAAAALLLALCLALSAPALAASVTISAVGDITVGGDPRRSADKIGSEAYYERLYRHIGGGFLRKTRSALRGISIANLETTFTTASAHRNKPYIFRARPALARMLSLGGINVVSHANNHSGDFKGGVKTTRAAVKARGIAYVGNGYFATTKYKGVGVAFCAFNALGNASPAAVKKAVARLRKSCPLVIVSFHWGSEYVYRTGAFQRTLGHAAIDAGASLVLGHHSHVVGGIEKYKGRCIVYSLGTFSSTILTPKDMDTFIFSQTFQVNASSGEVQGGDIRVIPCSMSSNASINNGVPVILSGEAKERVLAKIKSLS